MIAICVSYMKTTDRGDVMEIHDRYLFCVALASCIYQMALFASIEPVPKGIIMLFCKYFSIF